ncbi:MAG: DUF3737 family protein [Bacteroidales bacterium]|nr:DUF3737 family protein [Bacteroidales bacterium]
MQLIKDQEFGGERPLYTAHDVELDNVTIHLGESSIKESGNILAHHCRFEGKYVLWECKKFKVENSYFAESARSSLWYSRDCTMNDCQVDAPKMFRRTTGIEVNRTQFPNALETFWDCSKIRLRDVKIEKADYLFMHCSDIDIADYHQDGNYSFQYAKNVVIRNAVINSKDAFWESENVTIYDSELNGEYLAWYGKNIRLVRCHLTGEQLLCYVDGLVLEDCTFGPDANLMFEYSTVEATIKGDVTSIKNPSAGHIRVAGKIGELIIDENQKQPADCKVSATR